MEAGKLRHLTILQRVTRRQDSAGQPTMTWSSLATVSAEIRPTAVREYRDAKAVTGEVTHEIRIRHYDGLTSKDRVKFGTRIFNIVGISNLDERGIEDMLLCKEAV